MIILNGDPAEAAPEEALLAVLARLGVEAGARGVAVALDGEVVPRSQWERVRLREGARLEVLTAMQGG